VRTAVFDATQRRAYERELLLTKQRAEESEVHARRLAQTLQQSFIPPTHPRIPGLQVAAAYRPAGDGTEIGGDFYDVFEIAPDDWCVVIGDVFGKGVDAAVVTSLARYTVRAAAVRQSEPSAALATLNEVLLHHETERFCTLSVMRLRHEDEHWTATVSCGGHPLPFLVRPPAAPVTFGQAGPLVGVLDWPRFSNTALRLEPNDQIVVYTDGVTEARDQDGELYGDDRLMAFLVARHPSATELVDGLLDEVVHFQAQRPRDDIALVVIAVPGNGEGHQ
jgi:sigma-B regulation protein RsbU (phosphoserine phosphatase)